MEKDISLGGKYTLTPGAIPLCNGGMIVVDELDKMNEEDYGYLNNVMNDLKAYIDKAAKGVLDADVSIFATLNPRSRTFVQDMAAYEQVDLPPDLIDRADIIFPVKNSDVEEEQDKIMTIQIDKRKQRQAILPIYDESILQKYFSYIRTIEPILPDELEKPFLNRVKLFMGSGSERKISNRVS